MRLSQKSGEAGRRKLGEILLVSQNLIYHLYAFSFSLKCFV
jgi:hypothetical protein